MSLETGTRIADLVATNPVGATDFVSQGDDHIRLIKACVQGSFPNLGSTAVTRTAEQLNADYQPLDADLTAIALLATQSYGRSLLTMADAASARNTIDVYSKSEINSGLAGYQPLDTDLTAIAALTTATYGRDFLSLTNDAGLATKIAALQPVWTAVHIFNGDHVGYVPSGVTGVFPGRQGTLPSQLFVYSTGATNEKMWQMLAVSSTKFVLRTLNDAFSDAREAWAITRSGLAVTQLEYGNITDLPGHLFWGAVRAPRIDTSASTTLQAGTLHHISGNATLPALGLGEWVGIVNNSGSPITITEHSGDTTYWTATAANVSTVTVPARGRIVASGAGSGVVYVSGDISGST